MFYHFVDGYGKTVALHYNWESANRFLQEYLQGDYTVVSVIEISEHGITMLLDVV